MSDRPQQDPPIVTWGSLGCTAWDEESRVYNAYDREGNWLGGSETSHAVAAMDTWGVLFFEDNVRRCVADPEQRQGHIDHADRPTTEGGQPVSDHEHRPCVLCGNPTKRVQQIVGTTSGKLILCGVCAVQEIKRLLGGEESTLHTDQGTNRKDPT